MPGTGSAGALGRWRWAGIAWLRDSRALLLQFSIVTVQKVLISASRPFVLLWQKHMGDLDADL